ncbi:hypothetical protein WAI78_21795, partial [Acinetobacter baumannii]
KWCVLKGKKKMFHKILKPEYLKYYEGVTTCTTHKLEDTPHCATFIEFARNDLSTSQNLHAIYNAVSNAKRALHRRVDILCSLA